MTAPAEPKQPALQPAQPAGTAIPQIATPKPIPPAVVVSSIPARIAAPPPKPPEQIFELAAPSTLPPEFRGVVYETGMRGVGKSFLAAQAENPVNVIFWDFEEKGSGIDAQLHFGKYVSMYAEATRKFGMDFKPIQLMEVIRPELAAIPKGRYSVMVIDNIEPLETAFYNEVKKFPMNYGIKPQNAENGSFGGAWPGVNYLVSGFLNTVYSKGIKLVIVTAHLKQVWSPTGPIPNKFKPKGVERWHELSILSLVLLTAESAPIPSALVQKEQLASTRFNEETGEVEVVRRLPLRIPKCTFAEIKKYLREPADINNPKEGEVPLDSETNPYSDRFSKDQLAYLTAAAQAQAAGRISEGDAPPEGGK